MLPRAVGPRINSVIGDEDAAVRPEGSSPATALLDDSAVLDDTTSNLRFTVEEVIAHLSTHMTLEAGDVVHFGTAFMPADPERFPNVRTIDISRLDGVLSVEIEGLGRLENPISHAAHEHLSEGSDQPTGSF